MPGFLPLNDITPPRNRAHRAYCGACNKLSVITYETGARVCVSCGTFVAPDPPSAPTAGQVFGLYRNGQRPTTAEIHYALEISFVRFIQLVHRYLDDGSADRVNPELAEVLRARRDRLRSLRTVGA